MLVDVSGHFPYDYIVAYFNIKKSNQIINIILQ